MSLAPLIFDLNAPRVIINLKNLITFTFRRKSKCYNESEYDMQFVYYCSVYIHIPVLKPFGKEAQSSIADSCYAPARGSF